MVTLSAPLLGARNVQFRVAAHPSCVHGGPRRVHTHSARVYNALGNYFVVLDN